MKKSEIKKMNVTKLTEALKERNIQIPDGAKKPELQPLLLEACFPEEKKSEEQTKDQEPVKEEKVFTYAMRKPLVVAYNAGNPHAVTKLEALSAGVQESEYNYWILKTKELYAAALAYEELHRNKDAKIEDVLASYNAIFPIWKAILLVGEENKFHPNLWIREDDVNDICAYVSHEVLTSKGKKDAPATFATFRKKVETRIGIKMSNDGLMSADDRDKIESYNSANRALESSEKRLYGYTDNDGKHVSGVNDSIKAIKNKIEADEKNLLEVGVSQEQADKFLASARLGLKELENSKAQLEKNIEGYKKTINELKDKAEAIEDKLNKAEF